ncbi:ABC transporter permease [Dethiosulfovibrio sp. F2B]|uniref:ABC transporter permease n=1 Tax=Dethiosulfovibrio faecalis TaxID=2720018 RepID=UPI001F281C40|nr:ABC transporter permease [Dethiosulfovibrio faecalis]MCF4151145.1 ABC transporter permease [Dethiosulfovibrio faecalis]
MNFKITKRWSFWALVGLSIMGFSGPTVMNLSVDSVAPPFSKPLWIDGDLPPSVTLDIDGKRSGQIEWASQPPGGFRLSGTVVLPDKCSGEIIWETPESPLKLIDLSGGKNEIDLDDRDMSFKLNLGMSPFDDPMEHLFPREGAYRAEITGAPVSSDLTLHLPGERWGLLGTDQRGRDVFLLFLLGIKVSLVVGLATTAIASILGLTVGMISGYRGGWIDGAIMRVVDLFMSIPTLPILMVLASLWGKGLIQMIVILSLFSWMGTARTVRAQVLSLRESPFVEGLRALGAPTGYILRRHILPETMPIMAANVALGVPGAILAEAGLSFLGLSDPRVISWGRMLHEAHSFGAFSAGAWWLLLPPGLGIVLVCLIFLDFGKISEEGSP